jgi:hypothetical protein
MISDLPILKKAIGLNFDSFFYNIWRSKAVQTYIEFLNKDQLKRSEDSKGVQLSYKDNNGNVRTGYSPLTAKLSKGRKKIGQPFNLFDTGEFYKSIKATPELKGVDLDADFQKEDTNLEKKFGKDIIGLTDENLQKLQEFIKPIVILNLRKELGLL